MSLQKLTLFVCLFLMAGLSGCSWLPHSMQPHQLWKLNRGQALGRDTYYYSIPDEPHPEEIPEDRMTFEQPAESLSK